MGIGLGLYVVMILGDFGVDVVCIDCLLSVDGILRDVMLCNWCIVIVDLKFD